MKTGNTFSRPNSRTDTEWLTAVFGAKEDLDKAAEPMTDALIEAPALAPVSQRERELQRAQTYASALLGAQEGVVRALTAHGTAAEIDSAQAAYTLAEHRLNSVLRHLPVPELSPKLALLMLGSVVGSVAAGVAKGVANSSESYADFWRRISDTIGGIKKDYLGVFETAVKKNNDFQKDFTHIISEMAQWQKGDDKNTTLKVEGSKKVARSEEEMTKLIMSELKSIEKYNYEDDMYRGGRHQVSEDEGDIRAYLERQGLDKKDAPDGLLDALKNLLEVYQDGPSTVFIADKEDFYWTDEDEKAGRGKSGEKITDHDVISQRNKAIAEKWATKLGLPTDGILKSVQDHITWLVKLDFSPVRTMIESLEAMKKKTPPDKDGEIKLSTPSIQAWKVGFDAQAERIKNTSTVMAQKLVDAQSIYENIIKVLSSTIAAELETAKLCLQN